MSEVILRLAESGAVKYCVAPSKVRPYPVPVLVRFAAVIAVAVSGLEPVESDTGTVGSELR